MYSATPMAAHLLMLPSAPLARSDSFSRPSTAPFISQANGLGLTRSRSLSLNPELQNNGIATPNGVATAFGTAAVAADNVTGSSKELRKAQISLNISGMAEGPGSHMEGRGLVGAGKTWLNGPGRDRTDTRPAAGRPSLRWRG